MNEGVKTHSLTIDSQESTKLYFALNIKEKGYLKNGSIEPVSYTHLTTSN